MNIGDKLDALLAFLYTVTEDCTGDKVIEAKGLLALTDFKSVLLLLLQLCDHRKQTSPKSSMEMQNHTQHCM